MRKDKQDKQAASAPPVADGHTPELTEAIAT
jgi:hypothetical protein